MLILALDSALNACSAGLHDFDEALHVTATNEVTRGQAELLLPMVNQILSKAGKTYKDIDLIAVTHGPGAFTGIRVAMATAKSMGLSLDVPVTGVCTFEAILKSYYYGVDNTAENTAVILETKRKDFYVQIFDTKLNALSEKHACMSQEAVKCISNVNVLIGDAVERFCNDVGATPSYKKEILYPQTRAIAKIASKQEVYSCAPIYLRAADAIAPKNLRRIKDN